MTFLDFVKEDKKATAYRSYRKRIERWLSADARIKLFQGRKGATKTRLYVLALTIEEYLKTKPPKE